MFCTKCGAENPDGNGFCGKCGSPLTQSVQPQQEYVQQPYGQPAYAAPAYPQQAAPKKKNKAVPIIIAAGVVLALAAAWFFLIWSNMGIEGKLRHKWVYESPDGVTATLNLWNKTMTHEYPSRTEKMKIVSWEVTDDGLLKITRRLNEVTDDTTTIMYKFSFSDDGKTLMLERTPYSPDGVMTFTRKY